MWIGFSARHHSKGSVDHFLDIANKAAQWGADQELEACCKWLREFHPGGTEQLRAARRPNPPSLKEQALKELQQLPIDPEKGITCSALETIRAALEALDD
jgi:hypothetical protein